MKNKWFFAGIPGLLLVFGLILCGCPNPANGTNQTPIPNPPVLITYEIILDNLYKELIQRVDNEVETPELATNSDNEYAGEEMGQIANCQYVCNAINAYANKNFQPAAGTAQQEVNTEYLLKMVDKANTGSTSYGTGTYATKQVVDTVAVNSALRLVILFQTQTWSTPGTYKIELPAGTYKMTAVGGKGGSGGTTGIYGGNGGKGEQTFTITSPTTVTIIVGGNGGNCSYGTGGSGGTPGNGQPGTSVAHTTNESPSGGGGGGGASGIDNYYYVCGGGGASGHKAFNYSVPRSGKPGQDGGGTYSITFNGVTFTIPKTGVGGDGGADGNHGGNGGSLNGTYVSKTATTESSYVKIERV
jgi:hypothetical protein